MLISSLISDPVFFFAVFISIILAVSVHEFAHAYSANKLGDATAKNLGRMTLNPLAHLDPWGTLFLLVAGFGWGRPVPVRYDSLKGGKFGAVLVALAGPISNIIIATLAGVFLRFGVAYFSLTPTNGATLFLQSLFTINIILAVFNILPVPPLDGSKLLYIFIPKQHRNIIYFMEQYGVILLLLIVFFAWQPVQAVLNFVLNTATNLLFL